MVNCNWYGPDAPLRPAFGKRKQGKRKQGQSVHGQIFGVLGEPGARTIRVYFRLTLRVGQVAGRGFVLLAPPLSGRDLNRYTALL